MERLREDAARAFPAPHLARVSRESVLPPGGGAFRRGRPKIAHHDHHDDRGKAARGRAPHSRAIIMIAAPRHRAPDTLTDQCLSRRELDMCMAVDGVERTEAAIDPP
jgi:hypothetical protein